MPRDPELDHGLLRDELHGPTRGAESRGRRDAVAGKTRGARLGHWLLGGPQAEPLPSVLGVLETPRVGRYGVCCSGGGIRSAAFNLGALQALQSDRQRVLQRATYLAAVSGGSYMAAGFAMVAKVGDPARESDKTLFDEGPPPFGRLSPEEQYLRNRSSYMAPGIVGKLRLVARVGIGVVVNLLFLGSILFATGWLTGWILSSRPLYDDLQDVGGNAATGTAAIAAGVIFALALALGLVLTLFRLPHEGWSNFLAAWAERLLWLAALVVLGLVALPELLEWLRTPKDVGETRGSIQDAATIGGASAATLLGGVLLQLRARLNDSRLLARAASSGRKGATAFLTDRVWPKVRDAAQLLAVAAAGPLLLGGLFLASVIVGVADGDRTLWWLVIVALLAFGLMATLADVTTWSLHPYYRRRLASAFALRRTRDAQDEPIAVERDYDRSVKLSESGVEPVEDAKKRREWPMLIVCAAANVSDPGATPPGRAVTSFTFSPNAIGGPLIGAVPTKRYEDGLTERAKDFTLPAAVAMSGAALSPSMGKLTRWPLRFLLTLGNARLGVWVPNPRRLDPEGEKLTLSRRLYWRPRPSLILREMLGRNSADAHFVYVTDGGHYENLGLVELLRRGCLDVYCFDASGGRDVQELGDAIALARSELGVEIELDRKEMAGLIPDAETGFAAQPCVVGDIRYPKGPTGKLVYVRSVLTEDAPHDVIAYHELDPAFPHNSTGDQLYTDQRFEAYRALGERAAERAMELYRPPVVPRG